MKPDTNDTNVCASNDGEVHVAELEKALERERAAREQAEARFIDAQNRIDLVMEAAEVGIWEWVPATGEARFNRPYYTMLGYEPGEFAQCFESWSDRLHPEDSSRALKTAEKLAKKGAPFALEFRLRAKSGDYRWILARGKVVETGDGGDPAVLAGTHVDITETKLADLAIRESEQTLSSILEALPDPIVMCGRGLKVIWANEAAKQIFGRGVEGCSCMMVRDFQDRDSQGESVLEDANGERRFFWRTTTVVSRESDGSPLLVVSIFRDMTGHRALEAEAARAAQMASVGELAAGVAHEINNPINGIINFARILEDECTTDMGREATGIITREARRIAGIVKRLLSMARTDEEDFQGWAATDLLEDVLGLMSVQLGKQDISVTVRGREGLPPVRCKPGELRQVFINLLDNARHALQSEVGGPRELSIELCPSRDKGVDMVRVCVRDSGGGIEQASLPHVLDPFFTTKPAGEGTGLGLAISNRIIKDHGGSLSVNSRPGQGTAVTFFIPAWSGA